MGKPVKTSNTKEWLKEKLGSSVDIVSQELNAPGTHAEFIYVKSVCDTGKIHNELIKPIYEITRQEDYVTYLQSLPDTKKVKTDDELLEQVMRGSVVIFIADQCMLNDKKRSANTSVTETKTETTIHGPESGLSEDIGTNLNLIRHRYHQASLKVEQQQPESVSKPLLLLLFDEQIVDQTVLKEVKNSISKIDAKVIQSAGGLQRLVTGKKRNLFPTMMITERADRIAYNLSQGKVVILIEGSPFVLIAPTVFYDFVSSMGDLYQPFWVGKFLEVLRYIGVFISVILPAAYVAVTSYNPEIFRVQLALSIAGGRMGVPYPSYIEMLFMLLMMELLVEASIRLPKVISPAATTVGGLILGQAATEAVLVSNIMIIIVAAVAISNFVIPINEMAFAMRVVKYGLLALSTFFGLAGLMVGFIGLVAYLIHLDSFGQPYLKVFGKKT